MGAELASVRLAAYTAVVKKAALVVLLALDLYLAYVLVLIGIAVYRDAGGASAVFWGACGFIAALFALFVWLTLRLWSRISNRSATAS